ncbi:GNAT family N-acetyltransferase [Intrasporangium sp.]|uniref:GNAT family N-acetyltransferase n=1 Tax=Intrasporangium sp. TaxID=1925024 RepID=UPI00293A2062|nr:GNAT family N-acetyltransferase [Intrasporangium sp.]MDV3220959.1 GNAT family N-acetyltransferase [Intrasporangium sp.]
MKRSSPTWPRTVGPLVLRPPVADDLEPVLTWRNRPDVTQWLLRTTVDAAALRKVWFTDDEPSEHVHQDDHTAIALLGDRVVGVGSLWVTDGMGQSHVADGPWRGSEAGLGYILHPECAGRGYATLIGGALLDLAFVDLGVRRVTAGCFADNVASWRVMEKLGMRREQHGVKDSWHAELGWVDGYTYAILAEEWAERRALAARPSP